jgi:hypothetical protein
MALLYCGTLSCITLYSLYASPVEQRVHNISSICMQQTKMLRKGGEARESERRYGDHVVACLFHSDTWHENIHLHYVSVRRHEHGEYAYVVRIA